MRSSKGGTAPAPFVVISSSFRSLTSSKAFTTVPHLIAATHSLHYAVVSLLCFFCFRCLLPRHLSGCAGRYFAREVLASSIVERVRARDEPYVEYMVLHPIGRHG